MDAGHVHVALLNGLLGLDLLQLLLLLTFLGVPLQLFYGKL